jgi:dTDP-4-amino-4,6-dideoxygalactose transaminase
MPALLPVQVNRQNVIDGLRRAGVQTTVHYPPVHCLTYYHDLRPNCSLPRTEDFSQRELTLPLHPRMMPATVKLIVNSLAAALSAEAPMKAIA